jgi:hypothetical protein
MSITMIKSSLNQQGKKRRLKTLAMYGIERDISDDDEDIVEICSYFPDLREWSVGGFGPTLTVDGVREWKRICPLLEKVRFQEDMLSEEVKEEFGRIGVDVIG